MVSALLCVATWLLVGCVVAFFRGTSIMESAGLVRERHKRQVAGWCLYSDSTITKAQDGSSWRGRLVVIVAVVLVWPLLVPRCIRLLRAEGFRRPGPPGRSAPEP